VNPTAERSSWLESDKRVSYIIALSRIERVTEGLNWSGHGRRSESIDHRKGQARVTGVCYVCASHEVRGCLMQEFLYLESRIVPLFSPILSCSHLHRFVSRSRGGG
jgi:hypothetical protein